MWLLTYLQIKTKTEKEIHDFYRCWKQTKYYRTWKLKSKDRPKLLAVCTDLASERASNWTTKPHTDSR